jgi:integrase
MRVNKTVTRRTLDGSLYKITSTKADKSQVVPLCDTVKEELKRYKGESPFFFGGASPLGYTTVQYHFDKYIKRANVKRIRIHDLRHSFVSMLIHLGANFMVVADLLGDTVEQVTKTYGHMYNSDKEEIISRIG